MTSGLWRVLAVAVTVAGAAGLGALSRVPYAHDAAGEPVLRLAWRVRSVRVQVCRHRTAEEIAKLPAHMREDEVCERRLLPYRLRLVVDDTMMTDEVVRAAGAREDRPLYVFRQVSLSPGAHRVSVRFERQGVAPVDLPEEAAERRGQFRSAPANLGLDTSVNVAFHEIVLFTYDEDSRQLVLRRGDPRP